MHFDVYTHRSFILRYIKAACERTARYLFEIFLSEIKKKKFNSYHPPLLTPPFKGRN